MTPTEHQSLEQIYNVTRDRIRLKRWESIRTVMQTDDVIMLSIDTFRVRVLVREDVYEAAGKRLLVWERKASGKWFRETDHVVWDDTFVPYTFRNFGNVGWTGDEYYKSRDVFSDDCYRPGTDAQPMDNFDRTAALPELTPKMAKHWKVGQ